MKIKSLSAVVVNLFFPARCVFCGDVIALRSQVCAKCDAEISRIDAVKCMYIPNMGETILCAVPYEYQDQVRQSIIHFKFYGQKQFAGFYAQKMAEHILKCYFPSQFDAVTAVPISTQRRKLRGYNQSELIARGIAKRLNLPYCEYLAKTVDNKEQHKLNEKERHKNVKGVYKPISKSCVTGKNILLIDDIVTTGATLCECAAALLQGGARKVNCAAIAQVLF
jgi:competence protein ComFC